MKKKLWTTNQAAEFADIPLGTLFGWLYKGQISAVVPPSGTRHQIYFDLDEVLMIRAMRRLRQGGFTIGETLCITNTFDDLPNKLSSYLLVTVSNLGPTIGFENSQQIALLSTEFGELIIFPVSHWCEEAQTMLYSHKSPQKCSNKSRKIGKRYAMV